MDRAVVSEVIRVARIRKELIHHQKGRQINHMNLCYYYYFCITEWATHHIKFISHPAELLYHGAREMRSVLCHGRAQKLAGQVASVHVLVKPSCDIHFPSPLASNTATLHWK